MNIKRKRKTDHEKRKIDVRCQLSEQPMIIQRKRKTDHGKRKTENGPRKLCNFPPNPNFGYEGTKAKIK
mgnify:CR=1 FL=1